MEKQTKNNSKVVLHFIAIVLTVITIISLAIGLFAMSKYTANQSGNATAPVAKWNFNLSLKSGTTSVTGNTSLNLADTQSVASTHVAEGKIAPGTSGQFDIEIDTRGTEVAMLYDVTVAMSNCPRNIIFSKKGPGENDFTVISAAKTGDENERARTVNFSKYLTLNDITTANTNDTKFVETIKWEWPYELTGNDPATNQPYKAEQKTAYDLRDNADQGRTVTINITAVGTEVMNTPVLSAAITDKNGNPLHEGDTLEVYAQGTDKINIPTGAESVTFTSSDSTVATVGTDGTITGVAAGNAIITITGQETGKTTSINITVVPAKTAKVNGVDTILTPDNTGGYYGSVVTNYKVNNEDYQLFFIDYEGKYGNKGDIYLKKRNKVANTDLTLSSESIDSTDLKIKEMNPLWAAADGQILNYDNEKAVAWLCDTTVWAQYATGDSKARYAIGGPSLEMYVDSYNEAVETYNKANNVNFAKSSYSYLNTEYGYRYSSSRRSIVGKNSMYYQNSSWLASPCYNYTSYVIYADGYTFYNNGYLFTAGVTPLVCLSSDFPLELE